MIFYTTNNLHVGPLFMVLLAIDIYLALVAFQFLLTQILGKSVRNRYETLHRIVVGPVRAAENRLVRWRGTPIPAWLPWVVVIVGILVIRHLLVWVLTALSQSA